MENTNVEEIPLEIRIEVYKDAIIYYNELSKLKGADTAKFFNSTYRPNMYNSTYKGMGLCVVLPAIFCGLIDEIWTSNETVIEFPELKSYVELDSSMEILHSYRLINKPKDKTIKGNALHRIKILEEILDKLTK